MDRYDNDIFDKSELYAFMNKLLAENEVSACEVKRLVRYYNTKFMEYTPTSSNSQFSYFLAIIDKRIDYVENARLQALLNHFVKKEDIEKIIDSIPKYSDIEILKMVNKLKAYPTQDKFACSKWDYAISLMCCMLSKLSKLKYTNVKIESVKYLDVCCGSGKKTKIFNKFLKVKSENTYCADVMQWGPYAKGRVYPYTFSEIKDNRLSYDSNMFNVITCMLSLHHIPRLIEFLEDIYRVLDFGGYFILVEHCVYTDFDRLLVDMEHSMFSYIYDNNYKCIENPDYTHCYSMYEWQYILTEIGFELVHQQPLSFNNEYDLQYDNIFYGIYTKKK